MLTVGQIEDVIIVYLNYLYDVNKAVKGTSNSKSDDSGDTIRDATQEDFDRFARMY